MNTELVSIFTNENAEFLNMSSPTPGIDMMDWPLTPAQINTLSISSNNYYVTAPVAEHTYYEIEFDMSNNFWGCSFSFGSSANSPGAPPSDCGTNIRQAIAHLIDKSTFASTDSAVHGKSVAIDNPVPPSDGLAVPNPCGWDTLYPGTSSANCVVGLSPGTVGGTAFNCIAAAAPCPIGAVTLATGLCGTETSPAACNFPWMRPFGSPDFCAAAQHMIAAGLASGMDNNCVLTGLSSAVTAHPISFTIRSDHVPRYHVGIGISETICAVFNGAFTDGCIQGSSTSSCIESRSTFFLPGAIFCENIMGPVTGFWGYTTCKSTTSSSCSPSNDWWMYTGGFGSAFPYDSPLYYTYNSLFVSSPGALGPTCLSQTTTSAALDYMYLCNPSYDTWSNAMEFAACPSALGDPSAGSSSNAIAGTCPGTSGACPSAPAACSAFSAGFEAENLFGQGAYTLPVYAPSDRFGYLSNWNHVINSIGVGNPLVVPGVGITNYFTWLNAYSTDPAQPGMIRQGFKQTTSHLSPYIASNEGDFYILYNIMDSLYALNPLGNNQLIDWMTTNHSVISNSSLGYAPPSGTAVTIRNHLRNDMFWQDGQKVTAFDVAFSYISLILHGAFQASPVIGILTGVTVLSSTEFDLNLKEIGPFIQLTIGSLTIMPGHLWYSPASGCASSWNDVLAATTPAVYPEVSGSCLNTSTTDSSSTFDPVTSGILVGSGPWVCENTGANTAVPVGTPGTGCTNDNTSSPMVSLTLTRFGCTLSITGTTCVAPNTTASLSSSYFRSSANLARWFWSGNTGSVSHDLINISILANCFNKPLGTAGCTHWQQGIGAPSGSAVVGLSQISSVSRFYLLNWTSPLSWTQLNGIALGPANSFDGLPAPVLHEGDSLLASNTLNPASAVGCTSLYPIGGYDC